jgi:hypothetical protein
VVDECPEHLEEGWLLLFQLAEYVLLFVLTDTTKIASGQRIEAAQYAAEALFFDKQGIVGEGVWTEVGDKFIDKLEAGWRGKIFIGGDQEVYDGLQCCLFPAI